MLMLTLKDDRITYTNGFNATPFTVTRYHGEHWEQVGSDLLCGVADVFQDVGVVATGKSSSMPSLEAVKSVSIRGNSMRIPAGERWTKIDAPEANRAVYSFSDEHGWIFVPHSREGVEDLISWTMWATMWAVKEEQGFRSTAFLGYREFRQRLDFQPWEVHNGDLAAFVNEYCIERALFQMIATPGAWSFIPGSIGLSHLLRLADTVVGRVNTELTD
jgi:hypothetical protein